MNRTFRQLDKSELTFPSKKFPGHYYELQSQLGDGGAAVVFSVLLREQESAKAIKLYAAKVVYETHLRERNEERRRLNLQRELEILEITDPESSVTLIEFITD